MSTDLLNTRLDTLPRDVGKHLEKSLNALKSATALAAGRNARTWEMEQERRRSEETDRTNLEHVKEAHRAGHATDRDVLEAEAAVRRGREVTAKLQPEIYRLQQDGHDWKAVLDSCTGFLNALNWPAAKRSKIVRQQTSDEAKRFRGDPWAVEAGPPDIKLVKVKLPDDADPHAIVTAMAIPPGNRPYAATIRNTACRRCIRSLKN